MRVRAADDGGGGDATGPGTCKKTSETEREGKGGARAIRPTGDGSRRNPDQPGAAMTEATSVGKGKCPKLKRGVSARASPEACGHPDVATVLTAASAAAPC